jgi:hypothetical protein
VNQVMQRAIAQENHSGDQKSYGQFKETDSKEKRSVNFVEEEVVSDEDVGVCVDEWVDRSPRKPLACAFLKTSLEKREEMKFTFDVTKCDKLFVVFLQNNVIHLSEGHIIPPPDKVAKGKYCKWHDTFSHTTNECNYFSRRVKLALNDGCFTLRDGHKMKLDTDPFPTGVNMINFEENKVLVRES